MADSRVKLLVAIALGLGCLLVFVHTHYLVPDSAGYIAYARSLIWDADVDFANDYAGLGMIEREEDIEFGAVTRAGKPGNPFGMGCALLWLPFVVLAAGLAWLLAAAGVSVATNGLGTMTLWAIQLGTWSYLLACLALVWSTLTRYLPNTGTSARRAAMIGGFVGTPIIYYVFQMPSYSHVCSAFMVALIVYLSLRWRPLSVARAAALGAVVGLAGLVRIQDLALAVFPLVVGVFSGKRRSVGERAGLLGAFAVCAAAVFSLQLLAWWSIYGSPWHIPQGGSFVRVSAANAAKVIFASHHGLLSWSPVVIVAAVGWLILVVRGSDRMLGLAAISTFVLQCLINALPVDWWAGWSFGARRFVDMVPLVALGVAMVGASPWVRRAVYVLAGANVVQWLRVVVGDLSGEADPGWNALWGSGFLAFLPQVPAALWSAAAVPWTAVRVLKRAIATAPRFHTDPEAALMILTVLWFVAMLIVAHKSRRMWTSAANPDE
jgi:hypothetical protein